MSKWALSASARHSWRGVGPLVMGPLAIALIGPSLLMGAVLVAPERARAATAGTDDGRAIALLRRAETAPTTTRFRGTQFVSFRAPGGTKTAVVEVDHLPGQAQDPISELTQATLVAGKYDLAIVGAGNVADRPSDVVEARRATGSLAARWWLDRETGLVLRQETYDRNAHLMRVSTYLSLTVLPVGSLASISAAAEPVPPPGAKAAALAGLRADGWVCPELLGSDFQLQLARHLPARRAVQLTYSDGLASLSVFEQEGRLDVSALTGYQARSLRGGVVYSAQGLPLRMLWQSGDRIFTVVADASPEQVAELVRALPPPDRATPDTFLERVRRGLARVAAWFNPFA